ncbi:sigma 54-interacting transcriptional regulator [Sorangium sp. So ce260]|uniref:sigma 54-interacting transcriptional regulator n=1 Tax=Sorangium sp. So ce260 TaxID=3133291 RepID=UPI003F5FD910
MSGSAEAALRSSPTDGDTALALVIAWSAAEPWRAGEVAFFTRLDCLEVLGQMPASDRDRDARVRFFRQRPGKLEPTPPLRGPGISSEELSIRLLSDGLHIERLGPSQALLRGTPVSRCVLTPGDTLLLEGKLLLRCTRRALSLPPLRHFPEACSGAFGDTDAFGLVGESPAAWRLRDQVAFAARSDLHTLILGPSGAGKERVARAAHALSRRAAQPFIARNAATFPPGLVDAELFGNIKNYPNPGMPGRPGLVGAAAGGTLFLDEIGELPSSIHANLLRVLDADGEYQRLGETTPRRADFRLLAATNRPPDALKYDLLARMTLRVTVTGIEERIDDIPLFVRYLLRRAAQRSPELMCRFARHENGDYCVTGELIEHLLHRRFTSHMRELDSLLWQALADGTGSIVALPGSPDVLPGSPDRRRASGVPPRSWPGDAPPDRHARSFEPTADEIRACIAQEEGNLARASRALGLTSRYALYRLLKKHEIDVAGLRDASSCPARGFARAR